ncbi:hypothetical protein ASPFODRAFT_371560 [Aspergillus luchuensis CBS 106.47]|uniref:Uncharacterized protein n=1 Tax=Aspergillus luchuensis (strain CBS 106.47) TaxID=1137211 RepID=A0A1M3T5Q4_ASPLC|nr:hypothetical protein ASPFODRAFT_371560 [Aspergillus luchuensis CBS 106.47]
MVNNKGLLVLGCIEWHPTDEGVYQLPKAQLARMVKNLLGKRKSEHEQLERCTIMKAYQAAVFAFLMLCFSAPLLQFV